MKYGKRWCRFYCTLGLVLQRLSCANGLHSPLRWLWKQTSGCAAELPSTLLLHSNHPAHGLVCLRSN